MESLLIIVDKTKNVRKLPLGSKKKFFKTVSFVPMKIFACHIVSSCHVFMTLTYSVSRKSSIDELEPKIFQNSNFESEIANFDNNRKK